MPSRLAPTLAPQVALPALSRGFAPAFVTLGLAALLAASTPQHDEEPAAASPSAKEAAGSPVAERAPGARDSEAEIDAITEAIARKYRVSHAAIRDFVTIAYREGSGTGVDPLLIVAVMAIESRFNPIAQSAAGAIGLMQIVPRYHASRADPARGTSMFDPDANIRLGARLLKEYIRRGGTDAAGLQLYNGSADDPSNAYANKVLGERRRLRETARRVSA